MPQVPAQRPANLEYLTAREQPPTADLGRGEQPSASDYGRDHFAGPLRSNRTAQHRASEEQMTDAERTVAIPRQVEPGHPGNAETMVLPVFVTGGKEPEPAPPPPADPPRNPVHDGALPASERGMLVFVAALLGIGTIAVVTMLGLGGLDTKHPVPAPPAPTATPAGGGPGPVTSPSAGLSPSMAPSSVAPSPTLAKTTAKKLPSPAPSLLGQPQPLAYCVAKDRGLARAPDHDTPTWTCTTRRGQLDPFTPEQVCDWQYGPAAHAVVGSLADYTTWKCYN
ncbi:MAG TPA: hypothetical protein VGJ07_32335 [Rugosimonospora sp.]|jgi:hypothetical protein